jgi:hypothetical protein
MVTFYHTDCGHLIGCDDPTFDLEAERERRRVAAFESWLSRAIKEGLGGLSSSSPLHHDVHDAIGAVAAEYPNPSAASIETARRVFRGEAHSEPVLIARGIDLRTKYHRHTDAEVWRCAYWDGSPALWIEGGSITTELTHKNSVHVFPGEQPAPGNVFVVPDNPRSNIYAVLHRAGVLGEVVRSTRDHYECRLLL